MNRVSQQVKEGRFARPIRPNETRNAAAGDLQGDAINRSHAPKAFAEIARRQQWRWSGESRDRHPV
jgi:hypothetical protein